MRSSLDRILISSQFVRSERLKAFLTYLVEKSLSGETAEISEYALGTEVYGRPDSFDPQSDAIVRVEAVRLRQKLTDYYKTEGLAEPVTISLPRRTYVPVFSNRVVPPPAEPQTAPVIPVALAQTESPSPLWRTLKWKSASAIMILMVVFGFAAQRSFTGPSRLAQAAAPLVATPQSETSLAVLPFEELSQEKDQAFFADGLTEEIIHAIAQVHGLKVIARTSTLQYRNRSGDIRKIGADLGVPMILEGSVRRQGNQVRITAQLINVADGFHAWSRTFDRSRNDAFAVEKEIAAGIAESLKLSFSSKYPAHEQAPALDNYDLYLQGLHCERRWSAQGITKAIAMYQQAVSADPNFASAWAALAASQVALGVHGGVEPGKMMPLARESAEKALSLNPNLATAHAARGLVKGLYDWNWEEAGKELKTAHDLDSGAPDVHEALVMGYLVPTGRLDEALSETEAALKADPASARLSAILGMVHSYRREYDQAIACLNRTLELDPDFRSASLALGAVYEQKGMFQEALAAVQAGRPAWEQGISRSFLGYAYARMGRTDDARALLNQFKETARTRYVSPVYIAEIHAGLGERDEAFTWLGKGVERRSATLAHLKVSARFDGLRSDPRFARLVHQVGLD